MKRAAERPSSFRGPVHDPAWEGDFLARWCDTLGVVRASCDRGPYRAAEVFPSGMRPAQLPSALGRLVREGRFDGDDVRFDRSIREIDRVLALLHARLRRERSPSSRLKRTVSRYRRLRERALAGADNVSVRTRTDRPASVPAVPRDGPLSLERLDEGVFVALCDTAVAEAYLRDFYAAFVAHARRLLVSCATAFSRADHAAALAAALDGGPDAFFRVEAGGLRLRPDPLADVAARAGASMPDRSRSGTERLVDTLVREVAAYPYGLRSDHADAGVREIIGSKRASCVGKSMLLHTFLRFSGVDHSVLDMLDHSSVLARVEGDRWYLDPTNFVVPIPLDPEPSAVFGAYETLGIARLPSDLRCAQSVEPETGLAHQLLVNIALAYRRHGRRADALALCDRALVLHGGSAHARSLRGRLLRELGDDDGARDEFDRAIGLCPHAPSWYRELGSLLLSRGSYDPARTALSAAYALAPDDVPTAYNYGLACARADDLGGALAAFDRVLALDPGHEKARALRWHARRASIVRKYNAFRERSVLGR